MRRLHYEDSAISCGIYQVWGFDETSNNEKDDLQILNDLKDLRRSFNRLDRIDYDDYEDDDAPAACMFIAALADYQWEKWDPILRKNGWTCVTRKGCEPVNPNSNNKNRLYVLKRPAPPKPKKVEADLISSEKVVTKGNIISQLVDLSCLPYYDF